MKGRRDASPMSGYEGQRIRSKDRVPGVGIGNRKRQFQFLDLFWIIDFRVFEGEHEIPLLLLACSDIGNPCAKYLPTVDTGTGNIKVDTQLSRMQRQLHLFGRGVWQYVYNKNEGSKPP